MGLSQNDMLLSIILIIIMGAVVICAEKKDLIEILNRQALPIRWCIYIFAIIVIIMFGVYGELSEQAFIYLQF